MFRWIIATSLKFRFLVVAAGAVMVLYGVDRLQRMPVDVFPEFAAPRVVVQTEGLGMSTEEVEELITNPLEEVLSGTPEYEVMRSKSVTGLSSISLIFKPGMDILRARQLVGDRLRIVAPTLPAPNTVPIMLEPLSALSNFMKIGLSSKTMSLGDLSFNAFWRIRFPLMAVPGVANVAIFGYRNQNLLVLAKPDEMLKRGVTLEEMRDTTAGVLNVGLLKFKSSSKGRSDGFIDTPNQRLVFYHTLPVTSAEELGKVVVKLDKDGNPIKISDVASVIWSNDQLIGDAVINDGDGLMLLMEKYPWANTLQLTHDVEKKLAELKPGLTGITVDAEIFRPATFVEMAIANLTEAMLLGGGLVILVLAAFLFEWRVALISLIAIPLSLVAAGLVLYWQGATLNTMVLAGFFVGLGSIVDDAIIDIENILRRLRQNRALPPGEQIATARVILDASLEVRRAIVFATMIIVLSVTPVFFLGGVTGSFFVPLVYAYSLALFASMVVALTITPALALILLGNAPMRKKEPPLSAWLGRGYASLLHRTVRAPLSTAIVTVAIGLAGLVTLPYLGQELFPDFKERDMFADWVTKPGTSRAESHRIALAAGKEMLAIPGVKHFGSQIGRALFTDEVVGMNFAENWFSIDRDAPYDETIGKINEMIDGYPGIERGLTSYLKERIEEVATGAAQEVVIRIFGPDLGVLRDKAEEVRAALLDVKGLEALRVQQLEDVPQVQIKVNIEAARRYALKPGDVRRAAATYLAGSDVTDIFQQGKIFGLLLWSLPQARNSLSSIQDLLIDTPDGGHVRLADVADVAIKPTPDVIERENFSRRIDVSANVSDRDLSAVVRDVEAHLQGIKYPLGYHAELLGEERELREAQRRMLGVSIAVLIGILLMLQVSFNSWRLAFLTYLALPAALVGGVLAIWAGGGIISLGALVGFLTVLGIAARNGILLIHHYQHLQREEGEAFGLELVIRGARERLAPILMTSLCTSLALVPLVITGEIPGQEIQHPMAVVIVGGLVTSTLLNLFVVPLLYFWFGRGSTTGGALGGTAGAIQAGGA